MNEYQLPFLAVGVILIVSLVGWGVQAAWRWWTAKRKKEQP